MKINRKLILSTIIAALFSAAASADTGTWTGGAGGAWDTTDTNWSGVAAGTPWDITNGPSNTAIFGTVGNSASLTAEIYPSALTFNTSTTLSNGGGGVLKYAADNQSKTITVASGKTAAINADITYGGLGTTGNVLFVNGGGTLTLAGTTKLAAADTSAKSSYFSVEGGSTLNITGRLNTMILNSSFRASSSQYYLGGTSGNNTLNVSGSGKLVVGNFNIGAIGNDGNSVYISAPGTFNTATDPALNTASMVLYGNGAQLNLLSSNNLLHISNGAFVQQTAGAGTSIWKIGNNPGSDNNAIVVTGLGTTVSKNISGSFVELGGSGSFVNAPNPGTGGGSGNSITVSAGGLWVGGRVGAGMGVDGTATNNNYFLITGTSDNTPSGVPSYFRQNGATNAFFIVGNTNMATGNSFRVEAGARADIFGTGTTREFAIGKVTGSDNNYVKVTGVGSVLNFITGKELAVGGNSFNTVGGSGNHVDVFDGGALVMSNVDNVMPMPSAVSWTTWAAMPTTSTAMALLGENSSLNIGNGTANTALVKIGSANGHTGVELTNATSSLNFNNGRLTAGVTGNLVTGNGAVNFNGLAYINTPIGFTNTINRPISGNGSLIKEGAGTLTISGATPAYTGNTTILAGTLNVTTGAGGYLNDASTVSISNGGVFGLNWVGSDDVAALYINGSLVTGSWGATGSGANNIDDTHFTGTGILNVVGANIAPIVTLLGANPLTFEAAVSYTDPGATANDAEDGPRTPSITSSTVVPNVPGTYAVTWSATDTSNATGSATRVVNVVDTTAPVIEAHGNVTVEATSAAGAVVNYTLTATDVVDGAVSANGSPVSGSTFAIGDTTVNTSAADSRGNTATGSFVVRVRDTTGPVFNPVPADRSVKSDAAGDLLLPDYAATASATDAVSSSVTITQSPAPGTAYVAGDQVSVTLTAKDALNNTSTATFIVTVTQGNRPPTANADRALVYNASTLVDVLANDTDPDGDALTITGVTSPASGGEVVIDGNKVRFTPDATFTSATPITFDYTASDGEFSSTSSVTIYHTPDKTASFAALLSDASGKPRGLFKFDMFLGGTGTGNLVRDGKLTNFKANLVDASVVVPAFRATPAITISFPMIDVDSADKPVLGIHVLSATGENLTGTARVSPYDATNAAPQSALYTLAATGTSPEIAAVLYGSVSPKGAVRFVGKLGNFSSASFSGQVLANGEVPFYMGVASRTGVNALGGTLTIGTGSAPQISGTLKWNLPAAMDARIPAGVSADYAATGARYTRAATGTDMLTLNAAKTVTEDFYLPVNIPINLSADATVGATTIGPNPLIKLSPRVGIFNCARFTLLTEPIAFYGIVIQGTGLNYGIGIIRSKTAIGTVDITPKP